MANEGAVCVVRLSSAWVRTCVAPAAAGALKRRELSRYAERQFDHYFIATNETARPRWRLAVSDDPRVPLVCAAPAALVDALMAIAARHGVSLRSIAPWWLPEAVRRPKQARVVQARDPGASTMLEIGEGRLRRVFVDPEGVDASPRDPSLRAIELRPAGAPGADLCDDYAILVSGGDPWRAVEPTMDLLGTRTRAWAASWLLLLAAVVAWLVTMDWQDEALVRRDQAQASLDRIEAARPRARLQATTFHLPAAASPAATAKALQAAVDLVALRRHPWADVLSGVESASAGMAMLALRHDAAHPTVDLAIAAPGDAAAWRFTESLAGDDGRFSEANLVSREPLDVPQGIFTARARVQVTLAKPDESIGSKRAP